MWALFHEWCANIFGVTRRPRGGYAWLLIALFALGLVLAAAYGWHGLLLVGALFGVAMWAARDVSAARDRMWRTACLDLGDPRQTPESDADEKLFAPTTVALRRLALAVDAARRGDYVAANELIPVIDRDLLRPEELHLLDAVRAMLSLSLGDEQRAAQQAVVALPTGSEDLDTSLGRALVSVAWSNAIRLRAIDDAWSRAGVGTRCEGPLGRLRKLMRVRMDGSAIDVIDPDDARTLSSEARAIGDEDLAVELESRGRFNAYR